MMEEDEDDDFGFDNSSLFSDRLNDVDTPHHYVESEKSKPSEEVIHIVNEGELHKNLTLSSGLSLIVGLMIGAGIFTSPGYVVLNAGSVGLTYFAWILGGLLGMCGALCFVELGTSIPKSGGEYVYLHEAFGSVMSFLFTWNAIMAKAGGATIIAIVFSEYFSKIFYFDKEPNVYIVKLVAFLCLLFVFAINSWNTKYAFLLQKWTTVSKLLTLFAISVIGVGWMAIGKGRTENFHNIWANSTTSIPQFNNALIASLFSYDGWNNLNYAIEEMKDPIKDLPRCVGLGVPLVMAFYMMTNVGYLAVLSTSFMASSETIALEFGKTTLGNFGFVAVAICVSLSALGAVNGGFIGGSRLLFVTGRDELFPKALGSTYGQNKTPLIANLINFILCSLLLIPGDFERLLLFLSFGVWFFNFFTVTGLLYLRYTQPDLPRPFKVWAILPITFALASLFIVVNMTLSSPWIVIISLGYLSLGLLYYTIKYKNGNSIRNSIRKSILNGLTLTSKAKQWATHLKIQNIKRK